MTPATHTHTKLVGLNLCESLRLVLGCPDGGSRGFWGFFELSGVCGQMRTRARAHTHPCRTCQECSWSVINTSVI